MVNSVTVEEVTDIIIGGLSNDDADGNENGKKTIGLD